MKLGIVLVCIAAGVLLVSNVYARGDDGQGNIAGPGCATDPKGMDFGHGMPGMLASTSRFCAESAVRAPSYTTVSSEAFGAISRHSKASFLA